MMLLLSITTVSIANAKAKARDARRMHDLDQIRTAIDLYYADNGYYPPAACGWNCTGRFESDRDWRTAPLYLVNEPKPFPGAPDSNGRYPALGQSLAPYLPLLPMDPINTIDPLGSTCPPYDPVKVCFNYAYDHVGDPEVTDEWEPGDPPHWKPKKPRSSNTATPAQSLQYDLTARFENTGNKLRCELQQYKYSYDRYYWCPPSGTSSPHLYDAGRTIPIY